MLAESLIYLGIVFALCAIILPIIYFVINWRMHTDGWGIILDFDDFRSVYDLFPDAYELSEITTRFECICDNPDFDESGECCRNCEDDCEYSVRIAFSFKDYLRYRYWLYRIKKQEKSAESKENMKKYLEIVERHKSVSPDR